MQTAVLECERLTQSVLLSLIEGDCFAIRVSNYYDTSLCQQLASKVLDSRSLEPYRYSSGLERIGPSLGEVSNSNALVDSYLDRSLQGIEQFRTLCKPLASPIDVLRLELDERWHAGANLATLRGKKAFAGVARIARTSHRWAAHQDNPAPELSFITEQLAANVYLQMPEAGGRLLLWKKKLARDDYQANRNPGEIGVTRAYAGEWDFSILPAVGDLIIFRSTWLHAVEPSVGSPRMSCASFIGYSTRDQPLLMYC